MENRFGHLCLLVVLTAAGASGQSTTRDPQREQMFGASLREVIDGPRKALVVGNVAYPRQPLRNSVNDAVDLSAALRGVGFTVETVLDADHDRLASAVDAFVNSLQQGDVALFYYSGHGMQLDGENYLVPTSFQFRDEADARFEAYGASRILSRLESRNTRLNIMILDSCRDNPFRLARQPQRGWAPLTSTRSSFIAYATSPGSTASDNPAGRNGLFTQYLLRALPKTGLPLDDLFQWVREQVYFASGGEQLPWTSSGVVGLFFIRPFTQETSAPSGGAPAAIEAVNETKDVRALVVDLYRQQKYSEAARAFDAAGRIWPQGRLPRRLRGSAGTSPEDLEIQQLTARIESGAATSDTWLRRGAAHLAIREFARAALDFTESLRLSATNQARTLRGITRLLSYQWQAAVDDFDTVLRVSANPVVLYYRSVAYGQLGDYDHARSDCRQAITVNPAFAPAHLSCATLALGAGHYQESLQHAGQAIRLAPDSDAAYEIRGHSRRALGDIEGAAADYSLALHLRFRTQ